MTEEYTFQWCGDHTPKYTESDFATASTALNLPKNRYKNVLANESTLVPLSDGKYINANYICGGRYISCQAPITSTIEDFWRMNFEQNVPVIVMLTNYTEKGKAKASAYFVDGSMKRYGNFVVKVINKLYSDDYAYEIGVQVREIQVDNRITKERRSFVHIHYLSWPDFGVPGDLTIVTDLLFLSLVCRGTLKGKEANGPIAVHCSAGIGRSGTFICMLRMFEHHFMKFVKDPKGTMFKGTTDLAKEVEEKISAIDGKLNEDEIAKICAELVVSTRTERKGMIQTQDQFDFLIIVMKEFYESMFDKIQMKDNLLEVVRPFFSESLEEQFDEFTKGLLE